MNKLTIIATILFLFNSFNADAKCPINFLEVKGVVTDSKHQPVAGVRLGIFADDSSNGTVTIVSETGRFQESIAYKTYSGSYLWGDSCNARLKSLEIVALPNGYSPLRSQQAITDKQLSEGVDVKLMLSVTD